MWEKGLMMYCEGHKREFADVRERRAFVYQYCAHITRWNECRAAKENTRKYEEAI